MLVQSYEVEEVVSATPEESECAQALVNKLGLDRQRKFYGGGMKPLAWRKMTLEERFVFSQLCPTVTPLEKYESGPMPLRALEILERAQGCGFFESFTVWHPADVRTDPVLVGIRQGPRGTWDKEEYILCRWGEVLDEMPSLIKQALGEAEAKARKLVAEANAILARVQSGDVSQFTQTFSPYVAGVGF